MCMAFAHLQALVQLALLLVYDTETEVDLVGLLELRVHSQHGAERLLRMLERVVALIQNADAIPQVGVLSPVPSLACS
jgi:hypothetical protein